MACTMLFACSTLAPQLPMGAGSCPHGHLQHIPVWHFRGVYRHFVGSHPLSEGVYFGFSSGVAAINPPRVCFQPKRGCEQEHGEDQGASASTAWSVLGFMNVI